MWTMSGYLTGKIGTRKARLAALCLFVLSACDVLPGAGPSSSEIFSRAQQADGSLAYNVVALSSANVRYLGVGGNATVRDVLGAGAAGRSEPAIGVGDQVAISIWESAPDGLFSTVNQKSTALKTEVGTDGSIYVPYVGKIQAVGKSPEAVRSQIAETLEGQAINPEVVVIVDSSGSQSISILGDVKNPGQIKIPPSGLRLLDAIALANGPSQLSYDTEVTINRGSKTVTARLGEITGNPANNIWLSPRDTVQLTYQPRSFSGFGALTSPKLLAFKTDHLTLAEAIAQLGGLSNSNADARGVFIFRFESAQRLRRLGQTVVSATYPQGVPTVYVLDMSAPDALFLASSYAVEDKDMIYVSQADGVTFRQFVAYILDPAVAIVDAGTQ